VTEPNIRPEVRTLIERGSVTRAEVEMLRLNSWEWESIVPALDDEAFVAHVEYALKNCTHAHRPCTVYDDAIIGVHAPELLKRYQRAARAARDLEDSVIDLSADLDAARNGLPYAGAEAVIGMQVDAQLRAMLCWGVYCLDGPAADTWCQHVEGHRIETDERTARTIARLFRDRSALTMPGGYHYEARELSR
jgi:hypothetical protein